MKPRFGPPDSLTGCFTGCCKRGPQIHIHPALDSESSRPIRGLAFELLTNGKPRFHPVFASSIPRGCFTGCRNEAHKSTFTLLGLAEPFSLVGVSGNSGMSNLPLWKGMCENEQFDRTSPNIDEFEFNILVRESVQY